MKTKLSFILAAALMIGCLSGALGEMPRPPVGVATRIPAGEKCDLDGDGDADEVALTVLFDAEGIETYTISVNGESMSGWGELLTGEIWALRLNEYGGTLLLVPEYGPSDDDLSHIYLYENGALYFVGEIGAMPENMRVENGIITAPVRGRVLYTWSHAADFGLARGFTYNEEGDFVELAPCLYRIPRYTYPMGLIVTLKIDLPLRASIADSACSVTLASGTRAVLCASDDVKWVYIEDASGEAGGWLELAGEWGQECLIGGKTLIGADVFEGLWLAD